MYSYFAYFRRVKELEDKLRVVAAELKAKEVARDKVMHVLLVLAVFI